MRESAQGTGKPRSGHARTCAALFGPLQEDMSVAHQPGHMAHTGAMPSPAAVAASTRVSAASPSLLTPYMLQWRARP